MNKPKTFDIDQFATVFGIVHIPENTWFLRGYNPAYTPVGKRPAYYTFRHDIAQGYADKFNGDVGVFRTTRELRFYDLRYIRHLLTETLSQRTHAANDVFKGQCMTMALSYGTCSFRRQLELFQHRYASDMDQARLQSLQEFFRQCANDKGPVWTNPVETEGVRIAETNNDSEAVILLKAIFGHNVNGYIAPTFVSPYHIEKQGNVLNAELVVFDPMSAGIEHVSTQDFKQNNTKIQKMHISCLVNKQLMQFPVHSEKISIWLGGGAGRTQIIEDAVTTYDPNSYFEDPAHEKAIKKNERQALTFTKALRFRDVTGVACPITFSVSAW